MGVRLRRDPSPSLLLRETAWRDVRPGCAGWDYGWVSGGSVFWTARQNVIYLLQKRSIGYFALHAELIIREHKFRPLPETVHLIGRQTRDTAQARANPSPGSDRRRPNDVLCDRLRARFHKGSNFFWSVAGWSWMRMIP